MNMKEPDIVIIGAGIAGLATGAQLASEGLCVWLIEQSANVGGYAGGFERKGYHFDIGAHHIGGFKSGDVIDRLLYKLNVREKIEVIYSDPIQAIYGEERINIPFSLNKLQEVLIDNFPKYTVNIKKLMDDLKSFSTALVQNDQHRIASFFRIWSGKTFAEYVLSIIPNKKVLGILSALGPGYGGISANGSAFTLASLLASYNEGAYYVKGGTYKLSKLLMEEIEKRGGRLLNNTKVEQIMTEGSQVVGVKVKNINGEFDTIKTKTVVSAISIKQTYNMLNPNDVNSRFGQRLKQLDIGPSALRLYVTLSSNYNPEVSDISYFPSWDAENWDNDLCYRSQLHQGKALPITLTCFPTKVDSTLAPDNGHIMLMTILTREGFYSDDRTEINRLLEIAEFITPGMNSYITDIELATPNTFKKYTLNDEGSVFGWERTPIQSLRTNALKASIGVNGLFITGQWGPNFGVYGGFLEAETVSEKIVNELEGVK
ncbi:NAD(P)/FAD-dependent oxidoreductase [Lysinibacillus boronitolerans]|uniref:phytoene desaturase family protein n=1 Tax=Lysinibacillus boronitolerans TaxID=309788 RepID=UPI0021637766|nr:NAD(P)/FAD-dependent oxidoreductase [Lysinibacillus boronitolerans]MCS1391361.1 NAD(P)/FAD-dependent oxidoreductase [Lysinibacillus boronitolerans]